MSSGAKPCVPELTLDIVTDMLIAILNCCTKEELEEEEETPMAITPEDIEEGELTFMCLC